MRSPIGAALLALLFVNPTKGPAQTFPSERLRVGGFSVLARETSSSQRSLQSFTDDLLTPRETVHGLELLDVELTNELHLPVVHGRPRSTRLPDDATAIEIPGRGLLARVRRASDRRFGLLLATVTGEAHWVASPSRGTAGEDPWLPQVAVSPDGRYVALATRQPVADLGGASVLVIELASAGSATGNVLDKTPQDGFVRVAGHSLTFAGDTLLFARLRAGADEDDPLGGDALYGAPAAGAERATAIPLPPSGPSPPSRIGTELARSPDGTAIALLAGTSEGSSDVYLVRAADRQAINVTKLPSSYRGPEYHAEGAPFLAVSQGGTMVAYTEAQDDGDELYLHPIGGGRVHVSADPWIEPYIDNVLGQTFLSTRTLAFFAGRHPSRTDLFSATLEPDGTLTVENLGRPDESPPYFGGSELELEGLFEPPSGSPKLFQVRHADGTQALLAIDPASPSLVKVGGRSYEQIEEVACSSRILTFVQSEAARVTLSAVELAHPGDPARSLRALPPPSTLHHLSLDPQDRFVAIALDEGNTGSEEVERIWLGSGRIDDVSTTGSVLPRIGITRQGTLFYAIIPRGGSTRIEAVRITDGQSTPLPVVGEPLGVLHQ